MGIRETVQKGAASVFAALGNLKMSGEFFSSSVVYDPSSGEVTPGGTKYEVETVRAQFSKFEDKKQDNAPRAGDFKLLVLASKIPEPKLIDKVRIDGVVYDIVGFTTDPASAVFEFHTRAKQ